MKSRFSGKEQQMVSMHTLNKWASAVVWSMSLVTIPILLLIVGKVALAISWVSLGSVVRAMPTGQPVANNVVQNDVNVSSQV